MTILQTLFKWWLILDIKPIQKFKEAVRSQDLGKLKKTISTLNAIPLSLVGDEIKNAINNSNVDWAQTLIGALTFTDRSYKEEQFLQNILLSAAKNGEYELVQWMVKEESLSLRSADALAKASIEEDQPELVSFFLNHCAVSPFSIMVRAIEAGYDDLAHEALDSIGWGDDELGYSQRRKIRDIIANQPVKWTGAVIGDAFDKQNNARTFLYDITSPKKRSHSTFTLTDLSEKKQKFIIEELSRGSQLVTKLLDDIVKETSPDDEYLKMLEFLIENGANVDGRQAFEDDFRFRSTPIYHAIQNNKYRYVYTLFEHNPTFNSNSKAFMREAVKMNDYDMVEELIEQGFKLDSSAFYAACRSDPAIFDRVFENYDPRIDVAHRAVENTIKDGHPAQHTQNIITLIKRIDFEEDRLDDLLMAAVESKRPDWVRTVLAFGYEIDDDKYLLKALENKNERMVAVLLAYGAKATQSVQDKAEELDGDRSQYLDDKWQPLLVECSIDEQGSLLRL